MNARECVTCAFGRYWVKTGVYKTQSIKRRICIRKIQEIVVLALRITGFQFYVDTLIPQTHVQNNLFYTCLMNYTHEKLH